MKTRMVLIVAALLLFACVSFGQQGFSVSLYDLTHQLRASTVTGCENGDPLPDGTPVEIRWDQNNNGVLDPADPLAPLCNNPPGCADGPAGTVNQNTFPLNGDAQGIGTGYFYGDIAFVSVGTVTPSNFFFVIRCPDGTIHYQTGMYHFSPGPQEVELVDWTCTPCETTPPCTPTPVVTFDRFPTPAYQCADLCGDHTTVIRICQTAGWNPAWTPIVSVLPGCLPPTHCERQCPPAQFFYDPNGWTLDPTGNCWVNTIVGLTDGCVCVGLEGFLAVGFNNDLAALPMDNSVKLTWSTSSEIGMSHYDIVRDGNKVGEVTAAGSANTYNYVDRGVANGTSYSYTLRAVNSDATVSDLQTIENVTPSFLNAVITEYALHQNFPNPFNPTTEITFDVVQKNLVTLKVYNAAGQMVGTVANGEFDAGRHIVSFNAANLPSGLYFYTVKIGNDFSATKKMLLVK